MASNNLPGIGHNEAPDYAKLEVERLTSEYAEHIRVRDELLAQSAEITAVEDDEAEATVSNLLSSMSSLKKRLLGVHELEKMPHLRRGQGVDNFFFGLVDSLLKRAKPNQNGEGDRLQDLLTNYKNRKIAKEQERRRREAEEATRIEREARLERERKEREAEEARLAAERARKPETQAVKEDAAQQAEQKASEARVEETIAAQEAERAHIETLKKPADLARTRTDAGVLSTMRQEPFAEIVDRGAMLKAADKLWPHIPMAALQQALNSYARQHGHSSDESVQIPGARFGKRAKAVVR